MTLKNSFSQATTLHKIYLTNGLAHQQQKLAVSQDSRTITKDAQLKFDKWGYFPLDFIVRYERDFNNPGLSSKLCRDLDINEHLSLSSESSVGGLRKLGLFY